MKLEEEEEEEESGGEWERQKGSFVPSLALIVPRRDKEHNVC